MFEIKFSPEALTDLQDIKNYITNELCSRHAAENTIVKILKRVHQLSDFPELGAALSSIIDVEVAYRFLVCGSYTVIYKIDNGEIQIIRILYARRNYMKILFDNDINE